jgi:anti-sigma-K factor RsiG
VEPLPDFATLSDDDLRSLIRELEKEENEVSYRRRLLQGKIDILRAELVARLQKQIDAGESQLADVERLSDILSSKSAPIDPVNPPSPPDDEQDKVA